MLFNVAPDIIRELDNLNIPKNTTLEMMEFDIYESDYLESIEELKSKGYKIALDDFLMKHIESPLIPYADVIKVDFRDCSRDELIEISSILRKHDVRMLAEKVESEEEYNFAINLGYTLFQGFYLSKTEVLG